MKRLVVLTTNPDKQAHAKRIFDTTDISLDFFTLETPEIQAYHCEDVAIASALYAHERLRKPLVVTDAGLFIPALGGFPGPFLKFINTMFTAQDILRLMETKKNRGIDFVEVLAFIDEKKKLITFSSKIKGVLSTSIRGRGRPFDTLFIPDGQTLTLAELGKKNMHEIFASKLTHWKKLRAYLQRQGV